MKLTAMNFRRKMKYVFIYLFLDKMIFIGKRDIFKELNETDFKDIHFSMRYQDNTKRQIFHRISRGERKDKSAE